VTILGGWSEAKVRCLCRINGALLGRDREKIGPAPVRAASIDRGVDRSFDAYAFVLNLLD
jgi:hypothetical protein